MQRIIYIFLFIGLFVFTLSAQTSEDGYRILKANGKTYKFKTSQKKDYPYDVELKTIDGKVVNSSKVLKQNGKPTVLLFWMTTCIPCEYEMKNIHEKYEGWKEEADFNFYAISMDLPKYAERFAPYVKRRGWKFEAYYDYDRVFNKIMQGGLDGLPQTFLLDKNGKVVYHKKKYKMGDEDILFDEIRILLAQD